MKNYKNFSKWVNLFINSRNNSALEQNNNNFLLRRLDAPEGRIRIQPTYGTNFFGLDMILDKANHYHFGFYIGVEPNHIDAYAPVLYLYPMDV